MKNIFFFTFLFLSSNCLAYQETIQHGELFLRESSDTVGSGIVEMTASAEEEAIEITYTVTRNRRGFCPMVDTYLVQNEIAIALTDDNVVVEYIPASWAGCGEIIEGTATHVTIKQFPEWFDFCSEFRLFFGIWDIHDYVDVLECSTPITTTIVPTTTTTSLSGGNCPVEELYGEAAEETKLLRHIRDTVLSETPEGQELIRLYYTFAPAITRAMKKDAQLKADLKTLIDESLLRIRKEVQ